MLGEPRIHAVECESTQQLLLGSDLPEGALATADHQTAGRGRLGRTWLEPPGTSVLCSLLLRPGPALPAQQLSLVGGLAVAEAVEQLTGRAAGVKWPNDVLVAGRKIAGVLAERRGDAVVLGIGVNVNQTAADLPPDARTPPTSLRLLTGAALDREAVLAALLVRLRELYPRWCGEGLAGLLPELRRRDVLLGQPVQVGDAAGVAGGLDDQGRLLVDGRPVESGEVLAAGSGPPA